MSLHYMNQKPALFSQKQPSRARSSSRQDRARRVKIKMDRQGNKRGFGTLEVVIIIAVLLSVALIFRSALTDYANDLIQTVLGNDTVIEDLEVGN